MALWASDRTRLACACHNARSPQLCFLAPECVLCPCPSAWSHLIAFPALITHHGLSRSSNHLPMRLPLYVPTRLLSFHCPWRRHLTFRLENTIRLKALADTSHLWLHDARNVVVSVLRYLDEDVMQVGEELGYSCHRCLCACVWV